MKKTPAYVVSLGCPKNLVDTEMMNGLLVENGYELTHDPNEAEVIVVNTCAFIGPAKEESIDTILEMAEYKERGSCRKLIVAGCLPQRYQDDLKNEMPEIDVMLGTGDFNRILEVIEGREPGWDRPGTLYEPGTPRLLSTPPWTAYLKIAEGCDNRCSYCVIPQIRGPYKSRPVEDIVSEARSLALGGVKELILVAQDTTRYGADLYGKPALARLLSELSRIDELRWIRFLYAYPGLLTEELISVIEREDKVLNYIDLPLQHVNVRILKEMRRPGSGVSSQKLIDKLRSRLSQAVIRSTFIVGFPGETEEEFQELIEFVKKTKFDKLGVFAFSVEEGSEAAQLSGQIAREIKEQRKDILMQIQQEISRKIHQEMIGKTLEVLIEGRVKRGDEELFYGRSRRDAPEIDGLVYVRPAHSLEFGEIISVKVEEGMEYDLVGRPVLTGLNGK